MIAALEICHRVAYCAELLDEWKEHESSFALKWRREMTAKKKTEWVELRDVGALLNTIEGGVTSQRRQREMLKDAHLVEMAVQVPAPVVSCDEKARAMFADLADVSSRVGSVVWVNPAEESERSIQWLEAGAPDELGRVLQAFSHPD